MTVVSKLFHAMTSARRKRYVYYLAQPPSLAAAAAADGAPPPAEPPVPMRGVWVRQGGGALDVVAMRRAARAFVGRHDFRRFTSDTRKADTVREVYAVDVEEVTEAQVVAATALGAPAAAAEAAPPPPPTPPRDDSRSGDADAPPPPLFVRFAFAGDGFLTHQARVVGFIEHHPPRSRRAAGESGRATRRSG